jgi:hypothetical protein
MGRICHKHLAMLSLMPVVALGGCSGSQVIELFAADYRETAASSADAQLLQNILRAKDDLPIHFSDLAIIHGTIQGTAGATASIPIALNGSLTPTTISPNVSMQSMPTFDVGTLDTDAFTKGMLSPVDPRIIRQLFDQGVDPRLLALLFISEYRDREGPVRLNNMSCDRSVSLLNGECKNRIYDFLGKIDAVFTEEKPNLYVNSYSQLKPVGGPLSGAWTLEHSLDPLLKFDTAKFKLIDKQLYSISSDRLMICYEDKGGHLRALFPSALRDKECNYSEVVVQHEQTKLAGTFSLRSPYQIIQFLGQVLRFQEEKQEMKPNRCLTLDPKDRDCNTGEVLFQVNAPFGTPVVGTRYGDGWYALNDRHCNKEREQACDYSLQVLAILELLLNYNKSAKDIIAIPRVQVVQ